MAEPLLHLISLDDWVRRRSWEPLRSATLATEGFAHCTVGDDLMLRVANQFYRALENEFVVLSIERTRLTSPLRWERPKASEAMAHVAFPHVYGPIDVRSIVAIRNLLRSDDGTFSGYSEPRVLARGMSTTVPVSNIPAAALVYEQLGFVPVDHSDDGLMTSRDGVKLILRHDQTGGSVPAQVLLWVTDADALYAEWRALDLPGKLIEPVDVARGGRRGDYIDIDGNVIRFADIPD